MGNETADFASKRLMQLMDQDFQINPLLLSSVMEIKKIPLSVPKIEKRYCAILARDKEGKPIIADGRPLYDMQEVDVFEGWEQKEIDLPIPEFATSALISSNLSEQEISIIRNIFTDIAYLVVRTVKEGKDYTEYIVQLYIVVAGIVDPAKARTGRLAELMKTTITKGESKIEQFQRQSIIEEKQRKGLFENLLGGG